MNYKTEEQHKKQWSEKSKLPEITIVMPCLNEAKTLRDCIAEAQFAIDRMGIPGEIIVADNGSTDDSTAIANAAGARVVFVKERGYGAALSAGIKAAHAPFVVYGDCDGSYDFRQSYRLLKKLQQGADLAVGTRFPAGGGNIMPGAMPWLHRYFGTPALTAILRNLYRIPITDMNSGLRGIRVKTFNALRMASTGMEFNSEIVLQLKQHGYRITEAPITLRKDRRDRPPHLRTWHDGWRQLCILLIFSPSVLFLWPGFLLALLGTALLTSLIPGIMTIGPVNLSTNSRIVASLIALSGTQTLLLGLFAKYLAITQRMILSELHFEVWFRYFNRFAMPIGLCLILVGSYFVIDVFISWQRVGFGYFASEGADRILVPAATLIVFGFQLISAAFFAMLLDFSLRK